MLTESETVLTRGREMSVMGRQLAMTMRETSNLIRHEDADVVAGFLDLCARTLAWLPDGLQQPFKLDPQSAWCGVHRIGLWQDVQPAMPDLLDEWRDWPACYAQLLKDNPRLELAGMLQVIGELIDASSWPYEHETDLLAWTDRRERLPLPIKLWTGDASELDDVFYRRLGELRSQTGGWCWWDEVAGMAVWRPDAPGAGGASAR